MDYEYRRLDMWPGPETTDRRSSTFSATWEQTLIDLDYELDKLEARHVVFLVAVGARDVRLDGRLRAQAKYDHPGVVIAFDSKFGPLKYSCDTYYELNDNFRGIALGLRALRAVERYGIGRRGEQYTGWSALGPGTVMGAQMSRAEAAKVLVDIAGPSWWACEGQDAGVAERDAIAMTLEDPDYRERCYRWAVKRHHPDTGSEANADLFRRATEARRILAGNSELGA